MQSEYSPFKDLKILELATVLAGPAVGMFFAELGAKVLKIESPEHPDVTRSWKLPSEDKESSVSAYFSSVNYQKHYRFLDFKTESDYRALLDEVKTADLVLMNFKHGDQEKLRITDDRLREENPTLIIGKITGFGSNSDRVAYDLVLQAETGIMSMNGTPQSGPVKMPIALIDVLAAHQLKEGLLIELLNRERTKNYSGKTVTVSLYDAAVTSLVNQASNYLMAGYIPRRIGSLHPNIAPYGELFETADGRTITFAIGSNKHFRRLCDFLNIPELAEQDAYATTQNRVKNRTALAEVLAPLIRTHSADKLLAEMIERGVPCGEIKDLAGVFKTKQAQELIREEKIDGVLTRRVSGIAFKNEG